MKANINGGNISPTDLNCCEESREMIKSSKIEKLEEDLVKLKDINEEAISTVKINCDMMKAICKQNDIILKNIQSRLDTSIKFIYICIAIVLFLIAAIGYSMIRIHVL